MRISDWSSDVCSSDLPSNATAPGGSVKYTAQGVYSGESTPEDINGAIINWTIDDTRLGTPSATQGQSILVKAPAGSQGGQTTVHASVNLSATTAITGDALFGVGTLTSIASNPNTDNKRSEEHTSELQSRKHKSTGGCVQKKK